MRGQPDTNAALVCLGSLGCVQDIVNMFGGDIEDGIADDPTNILKMLSTFKLVSRPTLTGRSQPILNVAHTEKGPTVTWWINTDPMMLQ